MFINEDYPGLARKVADIIPDRYTKVVSLTIATSATTLGSMPADYLKPRKLVRVDGPGDLTVLVWERGAGETLSSGSSAAAAAAAAITHGWCEGPVRVHLPGGTLSVDLREGRAILSGPATEIFRGETVEA